MKLNSAPRLLVLSLALCASLFTTGCPDKNKDGTPKTEQQIAEERVAVAVVGVTSVPDALEVAIPTVRDFRKAGKVKPATALKRARQAKVANDINRRVAKFLLKRDQLGEGDRPTILKDIEEMIDAATALQSEIAPGESKDAQLYINLGITFGKLGLRKAADQLKDSLPDGIVVTLTAEQRRALERAVEAGDRVEAELDKSIAELEAQLPPADSE